MLHPEDLQRTQQDLLAGKLRRPANPERLSGLPDCPDSGPAGRAGSHRRSSTPSRVSPFPTTRSRRAGSRASRNLRSRSSFPRRTPTCRKATIFGAGPLPTDTDQYTIRVDQQLGRCGTVFGRYTNTDYTNTSVGNTTELGDVFFVQKTTELAGFPLRSDHAESRQSVSFRLHRGHGQPAWCQRRLRPISIRSS